jgi:hypothetical protein
MLIPSLLKGKIVQRFLTISSTKPSEISACTFKQFSSLRVISTYYPFTDLLFCTVFLILLLACFFLIQSISTTWTPEKRTVGYNFLYHR